MQFIVFYQYLYLIKFTTVNLKHDSRSIKRILVQYKETFKLRFYKYAVFPATAVFKLITSYLNTV